MEIAFFGALVAVAMRIALHFGAKHRRERFRLYEEVAAKYAESRVDSGGFWKAHQLHVTHRGARIKIYMWATKNRRGTVWEARLPSPMMDFRVYREGVGSAFGKSVFGTQDVEVGHLRAFDDCFMVKCDDPPLMRSAWSREVCQLMLSRFSTSRIESDNGNIKLTEFRHLETARALHDGIELMGHLAARDLYGVEALRSLDGATFHRGPPPHVIVRGPANIRIGPWASPGGTVTRASCPAGSGDEPPAASRLDAIGATFSREGKQLHITWPGIEIGRERLAGSIEILRDLTRGPSAGVFR